MSASGCPHKRLSRLETTTNQRKDREKHISVTNGRFERECGKIYLATKCAAERRSRFSAQPLCTDWLGFRGMRWCAGRTRTHAVSALTLIPTVKESSSRQLMPFLFIAVLPFLTFCTRPFRWCVVVCPSSTELAGD